MPLIDGIKKFIGDLPPIVKIALIIIALYGIIRMVIAILSANRVIDTKDKKFYEVIIALFFKRSAKMQMAKKAIKQGNYLRAGNIYEEIGEIQKALKTYEEANMLAEMGELYEKLNKETQAIEIYKKSGNIDKLIQIYIKRKNIEVAGNILENNNRYQEAAELYYNHERYEKAAQIYEKKGFYKKAAYIYEKSGNLRKAAVNFERWFLTNADTSVGFHQSGQHDHDLYKAVELYIQIDEKDHAYQLLLKFNKFEKAAELAEKMGILEDAGKLYEKAQSPLKAADIYEKLGQTKIAFQLRGEDAFARGNTLDAAEKFQNGGDFARAAELFEWDKQYEKAAYCNFMNQHYLAAADNYLRANIETEAAKMFELGREWRQAAQILVKHNNLPKAGELFEKAGDHYNAGISFLKTDDDRRALVNFQKVKPNTPDYENSITQMAEIFLKNRKPQLVVEKLGKLLQEKPINKNNLEWYYIYAQAHEQSGNFQPAYKIYQDILAEDYNYKNTQQKLAEVEGLIKKYKEMELVSENSSKRYKILKKIGEGGMGVVFKAEDTVLQRTIALKILNKSLLKDKRSLERFYTEARSTASLSHPNIVTVYDVGQINDDHFISMEFIEGENFINMIRKNKIFSIPQILYIAVKLLKALDYSHSKGIIHRDIKPHNIMITRQKEIKIMDFGLAVIRGEINKDDSGVITGTPYYMSPEQIQGIKIDHRTDIYSAGATFFHLISGRVPFKGENIFYQHLFETVPDIRKFRTDVTPKLVQIISKCMEKKREDRFQSAGEILSEIKTIKM